MIVYLTGGIGTGKSTVLGMFRELGAQTLSADEVVRELYADPAVQFEVAQAIDEELPLDPQRIAAKVFADAAALQRLEGVIHPRVQQLVLQAAAGLPAGSTLVYEVPLPPSPRPGEVVLAVAAPLPVRRARLAARGMAPADVAARIAAQPGADAYGKHARHILVNEGNLEALREDVARVWEELHHGTP